MTEQFKSDNMAAIPDDTPFLMFNALWFKPDGGQARYQEYMKATVPLVAKVGGSAESAAIPFPALYGDFDADLMFFVRYPNKQAFWDMITSADYRAIAHMREEAIIKSLLIPCLPA